jgi:hypothetical protein
MVSEPTPTSVIIFALSGRSPRAVEDVLSEAAFEIQHIETQISDVPREANRLRWKPTFSDFLAVWSIGTKADRARTRIEMEFADVDTGKVHRRFSCPERHIEAHRAPGR